MAKEGGLTAWNPTTRFQIPSGWLLASEPGMLQNLCVVQFP